MATQHASYLQTLPPDETSALAASLEKIKEHLSSELDWMQGQVQQKATQLQGIETLLAEITAPGSTSSSSSSAKTAVASLEAVVQNGTDAPADALPVEALANLIDPATVDALNGSTSSEQATEPSDLDADSEAVAAMPETTSSPSGKSERNNRRQQDSPRAKRVAKSSTKKTSTAPAKKSKAPKSTSKTGSSTDSRDFRRFLQSRFQDRSLTESVGEILAAAKQPIGAKDVMTELYEGLSGEDYNRAKNSITNVLTVGRNQGKWASPGRGLYVSNALATA